MLVDRNIFDINKPIAKIMKAQKCSGSNKGFDDAFNLANNLREALDREYPDAAHYNMGEFYELLEFDLMKRDPLAAHWFIRNRVVQEYMDAQGL